MPHLKQPRVVEPLWHTWDYKAQKKGLRHTVYSVNGDEYTGEWLDNKKHGKGTYKWKSTGGIYDGDWKKGKRNGFGTLSFPDKVTGKYKKQYSGGWKNDKTHEMYNSFINFSIGHFVVVSNPIHWDTSKKVVFLPTDTKEIVYAHVTTTHIHGYGTFFFNDEEYYEGEWSANDRCGWGRMYYADGSVYEGEWDEDKCNGKGMLRLASENRYEGEWKGGKKNGRGKFFYLDTGQLFEGVWVDNIPKCGSMTDFGRDGAPQPTAYPIPEVKLVDHYDVLSTAEKVMLAEED